MKFVDAPGIKACLHCDGVWCLLRHPSRSCRVCADVMRVAVSDREIAEALS